MHSDDEEHLSELRRAQRLPLTVSPIHSTPSAHRVIRQIIRGDYTYFQREAEDGRRRQRVYLVATDLSPEAEYALEWTIGTVLRDGDTLLAVYAVDEEEVGGSEKVGVEIGHGADVVKDTASVLSGIGRQAAPQSPGPSPLGRTARESSTARVIGAEGDARTKAEKERFKSAEAITDRCVRLLRKTKLQVRVVVEVFHCKSPKHMITEVVSLHATRPHAGYSLLLPTCPNLLRSISFLQRSRSSDHVVAPLSRVFSWVLSAITSLQNPASLSWLQERGSASTLYLNPV